MVDLQLSTKTCGVYDFGTDNHYQIENAFNILQIKDK